MSKAIIGGALIVGALAVVTIATGGLTLAGFLAVSPALLGAMGGVLLGGVSLEAGAIADALTSNRGMNITTRQPAANRQIIYGVQRVGGVLVYQSTTGHHKDQYNKCIVIAGHECFGIEALYLDGRRVYFQEGSSGNVTRNGLNFGGSANGSSYEGPGGQQYNFGGQVYCEARYGDQSPGDVIGGFTANDPTWAATSAGSPYLGGCTYVYLKLEYNPTLFPSDPEVRFTVHGKQLLDPRDGTNTFTTNAALIAADILTDPLYGLGDSPASINQDQLIAAMNVCDEAVALAAGGSEARYSCNYHYDTSTAPSDALATVFESMGGRLSRIGGQWFIFPAYWQGPSFNIDHHQLTAEMDWQPTRSFKDLCNKVRGTFICPNFPYNIAGNLYDANGFYDGSIQNNFQFGFQPTNFPEYACDPLHGYAADEYLNEDSGVQRAYDPTVANAVGDIVSYTQTVAGVPYASVWQAQSANTGVTPGTSTIWANVSNPLVQEISFAAVLSIAQAQRLAKIKLLRNRQQGSGTMELRLANLAMQPLSTGYMTFPALGWTDKLLEVTTCSPIRIVKGKSSGSGEEDAPSVRATFQVQETAESIYEWATTEELGIYDTPNIMAGQSGIVAPPTDMALISSAATAITAPDGSVHPRIEVTWDTPQDVYVTQIQSQYKLTSDTVWLPGPTVDVSVNSLYISPIVAGSEYDVQIQSLRANGATSVWVQVLGFTAGLTVNSQTAIGLNPASLWAQAYTDGTASITCNPFSTQIGTIALSLFPAGAVTLSGLAQLTLYYIYYIDPAVVGGNVTPIATTNPADYLGKKGYFLIGPVETPYAATGVTNPRLYPSNSFTTLPGSVITPEVAYSGALGPLFATIFGSIRVGFLGVNYIGNCTWYGFAPYVTTAASELNVSLAAQISNPSASPYGVDITATIAGSAASVAIVGSTTGQTTYSVAVPVGTDLSTVTLTVTCNPAIAGGTTHASATAKVYSIWIQ